MSSSSRYPISKHLGHLFLDCMKNRPDVICQIDAYTGEEETNASVLSRSIQLARCFKNSGLQPGDVLSLGGRNHIDLLIPFYAGLLNGLPITGADPSFKFDEIKSLLKLSRPKIAFCQKESYDVYKEVIDVLGLDTKVITFGSGESSMQQFIETYDTDESHQDYTPAEFDLDKVYAFLTSTSGTYGKRKLVAIKHEDMIHKINMNSKMTAIYDFGENEITLALDPINWISGIYNGISRIFTRHAKLQTSNPDDIEHIIDIINKYKPARAVMTPELMSSLLDHKKEVDLTCFRVFIFTGNKLYADLRAQFRTLLHKDVVFVEMYGMTETLGLCLAPHVKGPKGSCGRRLPFYQVKLVDPESGKEITKPNMPGELLVKGIMFSEYYNDPEETARAHTADGYYKTGDLLCCDENDNFYYVERLKSLIKYINYYILPADLEGVIRKHQAVRAVSVCGIPDPRDGQRPVVCVVTRDGCHVTAQEIKDLVAEKLSIKNELTADVLFLDELPMTSTGKIARAKLLEIVLSRLPKE